MSLGFTRVHKETAVAINDTTKEHIAELAELHAEKESDQNDEARSEKKLAFTMSDRAANEKTSNRFLTQWRNKLLQQCDDRSEILPFYCMAHVLLGFYSYTVKELKPYEADLAEQFGLLGRDYLECFSTWSKTGSVVQRVARTVAEVFGPVGDHRGARDIWEAFCAVDGVKSLIGNYRDNRFNTLFQTAAEIIVHRKDFITVLESVKSPNLLLKSVLADLKSDVIVALMQCLGLFYVKVTGPYWNLVAHSDVPYLLLHQHVVQIHRFLERCEKNPAEILINTQHWSEDDPASVADIPDRLLLYEAVFTISEECRDQLFTAIQLVAKAMKATITKQLVDFLPGWIYSTPPSDSDLARTHFAGTTNLSCEHHFGDLDSSQRRRPSATLHHHSSVQLIKRNRRKMMNWLDAMEFKQRKGLLQAARKGGKVLRERHINNGKPVLAAINDDMKSAKNKKRKNDERQDEQSCARRRINDEESELVERDEATREADLLQKLPVKSDVSVNEYVAIAYDDQWYPGIVIKKDNEEIVVKFLDSTKHAGIYQWPQREDIQTVQFGYVLKKGFVP